MSRAVSRLVGVGLALWGGATFASIGAGGAAVRPFGALQEPVSSVRSGVYSRAQAARGERIFKATCETCHLPEQFVGPTFLTPWTGRPVLALFRAIRNAMPPDNPGSLRRQEYADLLGYLFQLNGFPDGEKDLESTDDALERVILEMPGATR